MEQILAYRKQNGTEFYVGQQVNAFIIREPARHHPDGLKGKFMLCECTRCGNLSYIRVDNLTANHSNGCGKCSRGTKKMTACDWQYKTNTDIESLNKNNLKNVLTDKVFGKMKVLAMNSRDKFGHVFYECQCLECNNTEVVRSEKLVEGSVIVCSTCSNSKSLGQQKVEQWLQNNCIDYKTEYSFDDLRGDVNALRFDIYVLMNGNPVLIEIQGKQHYEPVEFFGGEQQFAIQQRYDNLKREYCKQHNCTLIEIPYTDFDNINTYLQFLLN